jgi:hypothetical protein
VARSQGSSRGAHGHAACQRASLSGRELYSGSRIPRSLVTTPVQKMHIGGAPAHAGEARGALCSLHTVAATLFFLSSAGSQCRGRRSPAVPSAFRVSVSSGVFGLSRLCADERTKVNE